MFEIEALQTRIGAFNIGEFNLSLAEGQCHTVLGPSGSGKSTLLSAILGTIPVLSGHIRFDNVEITHWPIEQRHFGYVPQNLCLFPHLSVRENLNYSAYARKLPREEFLPLFKRLVEITEIGNLLERRISTLSGGERQRVALVRALVANPRLVLLDEPFASLNEALKKEIWWLVSDLQHERGLSVLLVTHDLTEAFVLADTISVLIEGQQEQCGDKEVIFKQPSTLKVAKFLGIKNLFSATVVATTGTEIIADCPNLQHQFNLKGHVPIGTKINIGIRSEDIKLCDAKKCFAFGDCLLTGSVRFFDLGTNLIGHFFSPHLQASLELVATRQTLNTRIQNASGQSSCSIILPSDKIFWVTGETGSL